MSDESQSSDADGVPNLPSKDGNRRGLEESLWDLDDESEIISDSSEGKVTLPPAKLPERRQAPRNKVTFSDAVQTNVTAKNVREGVHRLSPEKSKPQKSKPDLLHSRSGRLEKEFNELDSWESDDSLASGLDEADAVPVVSNEVRLVPPPLEPRVDSAEESPQVENEPSLGIELPDAEAVDEDAGKGLKISIKPVEWLGLGLLLILLLLTGFFALRWMIGDYSKATVGGTYKEFPVNGARVVLVGGDFYWRAPVLEGENRDTVRRGTRLIPVVELKVKGGPAAIRLRFKDDEGTYIGDPLTVSVSGEVTEEFAGTAGFEDIGMHAAYRIGETDPWTVEVFEAESVNSRGEDFSLIHEFELSADTQ